ncbi:MAG: hypothetical protein CBB71_18575 [Rhodopirellula sp. TMED11]|nr:MAG: hypothetical protein CBB71_18575 [Rhodopirellula sp. TMED11]
MSKPAAFQTAFSTTEFRRRRELVCETIGRATAVIQGASATGAMDRFRQHNDFFYLCGVEVANAYLTLNGTTKESTLYLVGQDRHLAEQEGAELNSDDAETAIRLTGVDHVKPITALEPDLKSCDVVYTCHQAAEGRQACQDSLNGAAKRLNQDPWRVAPPAEQAFIELIEQRCAPVAIKDLSTTILEMRRSKSAEEITVMGEAGRIAAVATAEAIKSTKAGLFESDLAAVAELIFLTNGATGGGYRPIVASGDNIWNLHYFRNDSRLADGDLVLFDYAPDLHNYTSDIGRMWPVSGRYLPWQKELYDLVVDYHLTLLDITRPGMTPIEVRQKAAAKLSSRVANTHWSKPSFANAAEKLLATSRAMTHAVGMAVHDEGGYQDDQTPLQPGCVFALDPQLWVPEDRLYFRVEDCVLVTDGGLENLTPNVPHSSHQIEELIREPGLLQLQHKELE